MEAIAIAHSAACGWPLERYVASGTSWFVESHTVDYLVPAFEGDRLLAATWVASMETSSSWRRYAFLRESDRRPVAFARTLWIHVDGARGRRRRSRACFAMRSRSSRTTIRACGARHRAGRTVLTRIRPHVPAGRCA